MAFITGYVTLPIDTYDNWKNAVIGNGYDADGYYGDQCWDLCSEFWYNVGFPTNPHYPMTGPNSYASECWTVNRNNNISYAGVTYFDLIYNLTDVKKGDVVVYAGAPGHIGFADEDYNPNNGGYLKVLGQNQGSGGTPTPIVNPNGGTTANVNNLYSFGSFLGAFRYKAWEVTPPTPTGRSKSQFPWVLYAKNFRNSIR